MNPLLNRLDVKPLRRAWRLRSFAPGKFFRQTLRGKLLGVILLTTMAVLLMALAAMVTFDLRLYHRGMVNLVNTQAELLGRTAAPALAFDDATTARDNLALLRFSPAINAAAIYDAHGTLFATYSARSATNDFPALPDADTVRVEDQKLVSFKRIIENGEILGTVYLRADYDLYPRIFEYLGIALAVATIAMGLAALISEKLQGIVTGPILDVAKTAREVMEHGDYGRRAERRSDDEVGALVEAFNNMLVEIEHRTAEIEGANQRLEKEIEERRRSEREVVRLNAELEDRVTERTLQLQTVNQELEAFCYSVSHDLRGPLRAINGFSEALTEDCADQLSEEGRRYLSRIRTSTQRMGQLIEDLLNLSRVSRGAIDPVAVDVSELARQVVLDLEQQHPDTGVKITIWDDMKAKADSRLLRTALENLIGNAWKFTSKCESPEIVIGQLYDGSQQTFFVRDNGAGFDMAYADKLFGAFQRLHGINDFPGTGIGLATVQRIIQRHGGRIWANAAVGKGASFFFTLDSEHGGTEA